MWKWLHSSFLKKERQDDNKLLGIESRHGPVEAMTVFNKEGGIMSKGAEEFFSCEVMDYLQKSAEE